MGRKFTRGNKGRPVGVFRHRGKAADSVRVETAALANGFNKVQ